MDKELQKRMKEANEVMVLEDAQKAVEEAKDAKPIDYYQMQRNAAYTASQSPTVYGSPAQIYPLAKELVEDFKQTDYNINRNQYNHLIEYDAHDQAEYLRQSYMTQSALPLVESLVENYGVDALLNNRKVLDLLDEVMITPNGSGNGFTEAYLKQMHKGQISPTGSQSDAEVKYQLAKAEKMADDGDVRAGVGIAKNLLEKINNGELSASDEDYQTVLRGAAYGN